MRVKLDLRPENVKNVPPPKTRKTGLFMLCSFIIFGAVVAYAGVGMLAEIISLTNSNDKLESDIATLNRNKANLSKVLSEYSARERIYTSSLSIMQQELPTIEIFDAIDKSTVGGVILSTLSITQKELRLDGVANTEDNIVTTTRNLLDTEVFNSSSVPVVARKDMGPEGLKFTLGLEPKSIGDGGRK